LSLNETTRERIIRLLMESKTPLSARDIALELGLDPKLGERMVYEHLLHIAKTIRRQSGGRLALYMMPPKCRNCGYVFKNLDKPRKPSRCPRCKSERIDPPLFKIFES